MDSSLCEILQTASTTLKPFQSGEVTADDKDIVIDGSHSDTQTEFTVILTKAGCSKCDRCRRNTAQSNELCKRCYDVLLQNDQLSVM